MKIEVIPAINCQDLDCFKKKLEITKNLLKTNWLHLDITDGEFSPLKIGITPKEFDHLLKFFSLNLNLEIHLMVQKPEIFIEDWLKIGAKRIIFHLEVIKEEFLPKILEICSEYGSELMIALKIETPVEEIFPYLDYLFFVQFLAVPPGSSGQKISEFVFEKIKVLRERVPDINIEVDGGINLETAKLAKEAGANILVSGSYIFESQKPDKAFTQLLELVNLN